MIKTYVGGILLPVNPLEEVTFSQPNNSQQFEIVAIGDVTTIGNRKLISVSIKSLFTNQNYPWSVTPTMGAEQYVQQLKGMYEAKASTRFIITGDGVDINMLCSLEDFKYSKPFGEADEYYYTLSMKEYRPYSAKRIIIKKEKAQVKKERTEKKPSSGNHTVVKGDCLYNIAKAKYGDGNQWPKIYEANKGIISNPNLIYPGQKLIIP